VGADQNRPQLLEVAVVLVLDLGHAPRVLAALDDAPVVCLDVLLRADDGEGHGHHEAAGVLGGRLVILLNWRLVDLDVLGLDDGADPRLELGQIGRAQGISLGNDWDEVDARAQALHDFDIKRLERVAGGTDKVEAGVHAEVDLVLAARLLLLEHVGLMLVVEELDDGHPRVAVVDIVAEAGGVDDSKANLEELLLQLSLGDLDFDRLVDLLLVPALVIGVVLDGGGEERVDEGGLAQARLASDHNSEGGTPLRDNLVPLVGQIGDANRRGALGSGRGHLELIRDRN
jgi:hypothetical protein